MAEEKESRELTAEIILAAKDISIRRVEVPEWGGHAFVRTMSGTHREQYIKSVQKVVGKGKHREVEVILEESGAKLLVRTLCNNKGELLFDESAVKALTAKSGVAAKRCTDAAADLNGLSEESADDAKNVSPAMTANDSSSNTASPGT